MGIVAGRLDSPIHRLVVSFGCHNLWREIVWSTTQSPCDIGDIFGEPEIGDLDVAMSVQQQVFWLQVTIDDVLPVQIFEGQGHFGSVELGYRVGEPLLRSQLQCNGRAFTGAHTCDLRSKLKSSPPSIKSMTMYKFLESWNVPQRVMRNGCLTRDNIFLSSFVCSICFILTTWAFFKTLMA